MAYGSVATGNYKWLTVPISFWMLAASVLVSLVIEISFVVEN